MERQRRTGVPLRALICWTLIGLCCAGHRSLRRGERTRHARHHDRWTQRIEFPSVNDQGVQTVQYPSINDSGASSQVQVKTFGGLMYLAVELAGVFFFITGSCRSQSSVSQV